MTALAIIYILALVTTCLLAAVGSDEGQALVGLLTLLIGLALAITALA